MSDAASKMVSVVTGELDAGTSVHLEDVVPMLTDVEVTGVRNTPFDGKPVRSRAVCVIVGGEVRYRAD